MEINFLLTRALQDRIAMSFPPRPTIGMQMAMPGMVPGYAISQLSPMVPMGVIATPMMPSITMAIPDGRMMMSPHVAGPPIRRPMNNSYKRGPHAHGSSNFHYNKFQSDDKDKGPTVTVFVGNITDRAPDMLVKHMLQRCGSVSNWKRVQGASGKLQGFGFCEYADPESALRAIRLLHDWEIADKKLVVKVDAKAQAQLDEYNAKKKESKTDDEIDEETKLSDKAIKSGIQVLVRDYEGEFTQPPVSHNNSGYTRSHKRLRLEDNHSRYNHVKDEGVGYDQQKRRIANNKTQEVIKVPGLTDDLEESRDHKDSIDGMDLEDDKKQIISREIDKFRDCMKKMEEKKERERKDRENREQALEDRDRSSRRDWDRSDRRSRMHSPAPSERSNRRSRSRERSRDRDRERERDRDRESDRPRTPRERSRSRDRRRGDDAQAKEREDEEEAYDRRKLERKLREKEAAYQERLRNWETRERKKAREYDKEKEKEEIRKSEESKEAKRLKEFLEDYDDDRDDPKYYKGSALARRLKERERETEGDEKDRLREKEDMEELRRKLQDEGHPDPDREIERIQRAEDEEFQPKFKPDHYTDRNAGSEPASPESGVQSPPVRERDRDRERERGKMIPVDDENSTQSLSELSDVSSPKEETKSKPLGFTSLRLGASPQQPAENTPTEQQHLTQIVNGKRKKLSVGDVFNQDDDDSSSKGKKKKLATLDDDSRDASTPQQLTSATQEEKRKHIKSLIDKIPTEKEKLFQFTVDWNLVDSQLMDRRIKPWINKKIVEYIGEEEPSLVEFICSKVLAHSSPPSILEDVKMVLDDEAEVFVVKMWRLLIYEIEAKKLGLGSQTSHRSSKS